MSQGQRCGSRQGRVTEHHCALFDDLRAVAEDGRMVVWNPTAWGMNNAAISDGSLVLPAAFLTWLGFIVPVLNSGIAKERKSWKLFTINAGYYFVVLLVAVCALTFL
ncbi:MAG: DUF1761 domain-containing protein [Betaproteobacteria bacterium]|nr:MAG: DUF1761 domain-containing protein [Betaproteobacteria bacterium]